MENRKRGLQCGHTLSDYFDPLTKLEKKKDNLIRACVLQARFQHSLSDSSESHNLCIYNILMLIYWKIPQTSSSISNIWQCPIFFCWRRNESRRNAKNRKKKKKRRVKSIFFNSNWRHKTPRHRSPIAMCQIYKPFRARSNTTDSLCYTRFSIYSLSYRHSNFVCC